MIMWNYKGRKFPKQRTMYERHVALVIINYSLIMFNKSKANMEYQFEVYSLTSEEPFP